MVSLQNKRIWLIGASHGIGEALAILLVKEPEVTLIVSGRSLDKLQSLAAAGHGRILPIACDVADAASVADAYRQAVEQAGGVDVLIYAAGAYDPMSSADFTLQAVETMLEVNLMGAVRCLYAVLPDMKAKGHGHIALFGSVAGYRGLPKAMGYGMSKAAIIHLAENLVQDLDGTSITVQIINPGFVKTRLTDKNHFHMPMMITPQQAAEATLKGLKSNSFEIHYPKGFTVSLKVMALLPARLYFWLSRKLL